MVVCTSSQEGSGSRRVEVLCIFCVVCITTVVVITVTINRHNKLPDYSGWCGPERPEFSINITGARQDGQGYRTTEGLFFPPGTFWRRGNALFGCPCSINPCIRKCCSENEAIINSTCVKSSSSMKTFIKSVTKQFDIIESLTSRELKNVPLDHFFVVQGDRCLVGGEMSPPRYLVDYLLTDGRILTIYDNIVTYRDQSEYCLESQSGSGIVNVVKCPQKEETQSHWVHVVMAIGMLVSVFFLLVTFLVYAALPPLRNLHGKVLMCHLACLIVAYLALPIKHLLDPEYLKSISLCRTFAGITHWSLLASFFWLHVMSFEIWWIFSGASSFHLKGIALQKAEKQRFFKYSMYAWGGPLLISALTFFMDLVPCIPYHYIKPHFGAGPCWFYESKATILYFYWPISVLLAMNVVMFTTTAYRIRTHANKSQALQAMKKRSQGSPYNTRFNLYLKMFLVMGLNWVMDDVAFTFGDRNQLFWIIIDFATALQGVTIFFIFVCKRSVFILLRQKFCSAQELIFINAASSQTNQLTYQSQNSISMPITNI